jgi:hypothetical protein
MVDPFVPEADALDQQREVAPDPEPPPGDERASKAALEYPDEVPIEAPAADFLEQQQPVVDADADEWRDGDDPGESDPGRW